MEDSGKHEQDSVNHIEKLENKVPDTEVGIEGELSSRDANKSENGSDDVNKLRNDAKDESTNKSQMEHLTNAASETNEPMNVEGSTEEQIDTQYKNEESSIPENSVKEQIANQSSTVEKQADAENEVVGQFVVNGGLKEEKPMENGVEDGNSVIAENPIGDAAVEKPKFGVGEDGNIARIEINNGIANTGSDPGVNSQPSNESPRNQDAALDAVPQRWDEKMEDSSKANEDKEIDNGDEEMEDASKANEDKAIDNELKGQSKEIPHAEPATDENTETVTIASKHETDDSPTLNQHEPATPQTLVRYSHATTGDYSGETVKTVFTRSALPLMAEDDDGTPEDQAAFMKEVESFYRGRAMDFKPPKFYGQPLNCLKLWRAVIRLGGYDRVTGSKLWRQVGESFHPPKTCTTVSWTFRIFYEKSLLEFERHKRQSGELQLPIVSIPEASAADNEGNDHQGSGSGRARRDSAARAMQGWHAQRLGYGEVGEPVIKDKNLNNLAKREKNVKSIGSVKQKRPNEVEHPVKAARTEFKQLVASVVDVGPGPPADWVKINVRQTKDCFEVYALVPGLLREEVRVQSDPAGRLVITGQPEQAENPWGITPFKKVVSLPARIDPLQTSAVVSLHGRLFVKVPFELPNN